LREELIVICLNPDGQDERIGRIKPINEVHSVNTENSVNSGSDKVNANLVRLCVVVGVLNYPQTS